MCRIRVYVTRWTSCSLPLIHRPLFPSTAWQHSLPLMDARVKCVGWWLTRPPAPPPFSQVFFFFMHNNSQVLNTSPTKWAAVCWAINLPDAHKCSEWIVQTVNQSVCRTWWSGLSLLVSQQVIPSHITQSAGQPRSQPGRGGVSVTPRSHQPRWQAHCESSPPLTKVFTLAETIIRRWSCCRNCCAETDTLKRN